MCVVSGPLALGLGKAAPWFYAALGLGATKKYFDYKRENKIAKFQQNAALAEAESANEAFIAEQEGLASRLKEERKANAQEQLALARKGLQAQGQVRASERAGLTIDMLLGDVERQTGEASNLLNQTLASTVQQYRRNTLGLKAKRQNRLNTAESNYNLASSKRRGGLDFALDTLSTGVSNYYKFV